MRIWMATLTEETGSEKTLLSPRIATKKSVYSALLVALLADVEA
jgi:hypothetical protein